MTPLEHSLRQCVDSVGRKVGGERAASRQRTQNNGLGGRRPGTSGGDEGEGGGAGAAQIVVDTFLPSEREQVLEMWLTLDGVVDILNDAHSANGQGPSAAGDGGAEGAVEAVAGAGADGAATAGGTLPEIKA